YLTGAYHPFGKPRSASSRWSLPRHRLPLGHRKRRIGDDGMNTRTLGRTGYEVSEIGLGCWQLGESFGPVNDETAASILGTARRLDVNFWDTADVYGGGQSERRIGGFRDKQGVFVATKLGRGPEFEG